MRTFTAAITFGTVLSAAFTTTLGNPMQARRGTLLRKDAEVLNSVPAQDQGNVNPEVDASVKPAVDTPEEGAEQDDYEDADDDFIGYFEKPYKCNVELVQKMNDGDKEKNFYSNYLANDCADNCLWTADCNSFSVGKGVSDELFDHCMLFEGDKDSVQEKNPDLIIIDPKTCDIKGAEFLDSQFDKPVNNDETEPPERPEELPEEGVPTNDEESDDKDKPKNPAKF